MHFHLPKPLHGWREFVGEVGIIVIGVLIALGAEQVVEAMHWRSEVEAARQSLYDTVPGNLNAAKWRQQQQPCVDRRLAEIDQIFEAHALGRPIRLLGTIAMPVALTGSQTAWQVALSSQALAHMSLKEKGEFADAFGNYATLTQVLDREREAWLRLGTLDDPTILSDGDWPALHQAYGEAKALNARVQIVTDYVLTQENLGHRPDLKDDLPEGVQAALKTYCSPVLAKS
jgi:hypothetical protein